jgi:hypothetical protein
VIALVSLADASFIYIVNSVVGRAAWATNGHMGRVGGEAEVKSLGFRLVMAFHKEPVLEEGQGVSIHKAVRIG